MKEIKIVAISDLHGGLAFLDSLPDGDILTISGDICPVRGSHNPTNQAHWINNHFHPWCSDLIDRGVFKHITWINGNHDFFINPKRNLLTENGFVIPPNVHCLNNRMIELDGVKIFGSPWTPTFGNWAWMKSEEELKDIFAKIPEGLDILLSHGPAYCLNDTITQYPERTEGRDPHIGSKALRDRIKIAKPKMVLVGHIHSGSHAVQRLYLEPDFTDHIDSVNVSIMDEDYEVVYKPYEFTIQK